MIEQHVQQADIRFEIRPNQSLGREGRIFFFLVIFIASMLLTVRFILIGAWMVLPYTLAEMAVLAMALFFIERSSRYSEEIRVTGDEMCVTARRGMTTLKQWVFQVYWVQVELKKDKVRWYPNKLFLSSHGKLIRVGACLTDEERTELSIALSAALDARKKGLAGENI